MSELSLSLLGPVRATVSEQPIEFRTQKAEAILLYLVAEMAFHPTARVRREALLGLLWPDYPGRSARQSLRTNLSYLRKAIPELVTQEGDGRESLVLGDNQSLWINPAARFDLDVDAFLALLGQNDRHQHEALLTCDPCQRRLREATDLYRGDFLADFYLPDSQPFEEWVSARRAELQRLVLEALASRGEYYLGQGQYDEAESIARRQLQIDNLRESAHRQLMEALARSGRRSAALQQVETLRELLQQELGIEPSAETQALAESIRDDELGQPAEFVPPEPTAAEPRARLDLPAQTTPFIGREREIAEVKALLQRARLVTLTGPGGTGKTRLGLQLAAAIADQYAHGVTFVSLASTADPALVTNAIAQKLGVVEQPNWPLAESIQRYLGEKQLLLLLDSFEHVLEVAPLVSDLLAAAPRLSVLVTSRELLRLNGEYEVVVPPLAIPEPKHVSSVSDLAGYESVALFAERARAASASFRLTEENAPAVASICIRLDGLPLAIELAAARIKLFNPQQLLTRLESRLGLLTGGPRDLPDRQRTLRDTIDWSYDLLDEGERQLFARLAAFTGGRSLEAVEAVCAAGLTIDVLDGLESLLNKSLLYQAESPNGENRFIMLETIHEYARERLAASGEEHLIRNRHLVFFLEMAEEAQPQLEGPDAAAWLSQLEVEHDNLRTALEWSQAAGEAEESTLRLAGSLGEFWRWRGYINEGRIRLSQVLFQQATLQKTVPRANALYHAAGLAYDQGDFQSARAQLQESLSIYRELGQADTIGFAHALRLSGVTEIAVGDYTKAAALLNEALALFRELKDMYGTAKALWQLGWQAIRTGDYELASRYFAESAALYRHIGNKDDLTYVLAGSGELALRQGDYERASTLLNESLSLHKETGHSWGVAAVLGNLGWLALRQGDFNLARSRIAESLTMRREMGDIGGIAWCLEKMAEVVLIRRRGEPTGGDHALRRAARLFGAAAGLRDPLGSVIDLADRPEHERLLEEIRAQLDEASFTAAWAEGQAMIVAQAVAYALGE